jgi:hypothetical protein
MQTINMKWLYMLLLLCFLLLVVNPQKKKKKVSFSERVTVYLI